MNQIPNQVLLIFALSGKTWEQIRSRLASPRRMIRYFQCLLSEEGRTECLIERARNLSTRLQQILPTPMVATVSDYQKEYFKYILQTFHWKCKHILGNSIPTSYSKSQLVKVSKMCIREWNAMVQSLHGKWMFLFGIINQADLEIHDTWHLATLLEFCLRNKLLKQFELSRTEYARDKRMLNALILFLKADGYLEECRKMTIARQKKFDYVGVELI